MMQMLPLVFGSGTASEEISFGDKVAVAYNGRYRLFGELGDTHCLGIATHDANPGEPIEFMICGSEQDLFKRHNEHRSEWHE